MTITDEDRREAERLALLSKDEQRRIIAMHWTDGNNPKVPARDRKFARERAEALESLLRLKKHRK